MTSFFTPLGLCGDPFSARATEFFPTEQATAALNRLSPVLELGGIGVMLGDPGMGKSTVLNHMLSQQVDKNRYHCVQVEFTNLSAGSFLRQLVFASDESPRRSKSDVVHQLVSLWTRIPQRLFLVVDEAHHMSGEALEDFRLLLTTVGSRKAVTVVLAGHPELRDLLRSPMQQSLSQRILMRCMLRGWTLGETRDWIAQRLAAMGGPEALISADAVEALYHYAKGNPRVIGQTLNACLIHMVLKSEKALDADGFKRVLAGLEG